MELSDEQLEDLYKRYLNNQCSAEELRLMVAILGGEEPGYSEHRVTALFNKTWATIEAPPGYYPLPELELPEQPAGTPTHRIGHRRWWWAAASILCLLIAAAWLFLKQEAPKAKKDTATMNHPVLPGTNGATLTLADGSVLTLDSAGKDRRLVLEKTNATLHDGSITYQGKEAVTTSEFNTLSTARGKQFKIELSDGTAVWLNAASSIRYPSVFANDERVVELDGEAYFEVARSLSPGQHKPIPFKVIVAAQNGRPAQTIEVLGTHFNINSYADEPLSKTTLLEGSVRVNDELLKPGQQYRTDGRSHQIIPADMEEAVSWKNGYFKFKDENLESVMRKIVRWYNVNVIYEGAVPTDKFNGSISRSRNLEDVLDLLQATKVVHLSVQGNTITIKKA